MSAMDKEPSSAREPCGKENNLLGGNSANDEINVSCFPSWNLRDKERERGSSAQNSPQQKSLYSRRLENGNGMSKPNINNGHSARRGSLLHQHILNSNNQINKANSVSAIGDGNAVANYGKVRQQSNDRKLLNTGSNPLVSFDSKDNGGFQMCRSREDSGHSFTRATGIQRVLSEKRILGTDPPAATFQNPTISTTMRQSVTRNSQSRKSLGGVTLEPLQRETSREVDNRSNAKSLNCRLGSGDGLNSFRSDSGARKAVKPTGIPVKTTTGNVMRSGSLQKDTPKNSRNPPIAKLSSRDRARTASDDDAQLLYNENNSHTSQQLAGQRDYSLDGQSKLANIPTLPCRKPLDAKSTEPHPGQMLLGHAQIPAGLKEKTPAVLMSQETHAEFDRGVTREVEELKLEILCLREAVEKLTVLTTQIMTQNPSPKVTISDENVAQIAAPIASRIIRAIRSSSDSGTCPLCEKPTSQMPRIPARSPMLNESLAYSENGTELGNSIFPIPTPNTNMSMSRIGASAIPMRSDRPRDSGPPSLDFRPLAPENKPVQSVGSRASSITSVPAEDEENTPRPSRYDV